MWYVCGVRYAILYVRVSCFVVRGCVVSGRYINICYCDMFSVANVYHDHLNFCFAYLQYDELSLTFTTLCVCGGCCDSDECTFVCVACVYAESV